MADIDFDMVITAEGITLARETQLNPGWYLIPKRWACSVTKGALSDARTSLDMNEAWTGNFFSGVYSSGSNGLLHNIVFGPDEGEPTIASYNIGEIYFIYEDHNGSEFLYAIAQPKTVMTYNKGVSQTFSFLFTLNNTTIPNTFEINYTFPQDIESHNQQISSHPYLLARDGSRTATDILKYSDSLTFESELDIPSKGYVDDKINNLILEAAPPGSLMFWPGPKPPGGWLERNGSEFLINDFPRLAEFLLSISSSYTGSRSGWFKVPDDRGLFIRAWNRSPASATNPGIDPGRAIGSYQPDAAPEISGSAQWTQEWESFGWYGYYGAFRLSDRRGNGVDGTRGTFDIVQFKASYCSPSYGRANEVRPCNRAYLPIIKY